MLKPDSNIEAISQTIRERSTFIVKRCAGPEHRWRQDSIQTLPAAQGAASDNQPAP
jgi:hypothetical protein